MANDIVHDGKKSSVILSIYRFPAYYCAVLSVNVRIMISQLSAMFVIFFYLVFQRIV